jgi:hypothetical protein
VPERVQFHGEHPDLGFDQVPGQCSVASTDVYDQLSGPQIGVGNDAPSPLIKSGCQPHARRDRAMPDTTEP